MTDALGQRTSVKQNGSAFADYYDTGNTSTPIFQGSRTGSATVFQAISTTTLLELVAPSARQWPCAIGESPSG